MALSKAAGSGSLSLDSCDGKELAGLAKRIPAVKALKDSDVFEKLKGQRRTVVKMVDLVLKFPELSAQLWAQAEPMLQKHLEDQESKADLFSDQYKKCWRIPGSWKASWIAKASKGSILEEWLSAIVTACAGKQDVLHEVFYNLTGQCPSSSVPALCQSKRVCSRVYEYMLVNYYQHRLARLVDAIRDKKVNWAELGPYTVEFDDKTLMAITLQHDCDELKVQIPADDSFSSSWKLYMAHVDMEAYVQAPTTKRCVLLHSYFPANRGPHKVQKKLEAIAQEAHQAIEKEVKQLQGSLVSENAAVSEAVRAQKKATAKARAANMVAAKKKAKLDAGLTMSSPASNAFA